MDSKAGADLVRQVQTLRERLGKHLRGFTSGLPEGVDPEGLSRRSPDPSLFPVPELVLFALREIMGFRWSGLGEKTRWTVWATVAGQPFGFALQKTGFRVLYDRDVDRALVRRVEGQLSSSLKLLEPLLAALADTQIELGNLTLANRMGLQEERYRYFRELADGHFARAKQVDEEPRRQDGKPPDIVAYLVEGMNRQIEAEQHGFFASGAMVDAWFSGLEHRMLLLRAFLGRPLPPGGFRAFLAARWDERLEILIKELGVRGSGEMLGRLRQVKKTIRNPFAHGGVENDGGSFHFHLPRVGAIPANLSRYRGRVRMSFFPISGAGHVEACAIFDEVDGFLTTGLFEPPHQFIRWGVDPSFDVATMTSYADAIAEGPGAVDALIEGIGRETDRHDNMDY